MIGAGCSILATHVRMLTGGLITSDWLIPVTWEAWLVAPPISVDAHTAVSCVGCSGWVMCVCVADIRGGNRRNNSSVQLNHLFT